jgi:hypothetical protein
MSRALVVGTVATVLIGGITTPTLAAARWRIVPSPPGPGSLSAVSAISATDAWAVGRIGIRLAASTLAVHWDGHAWSRVPTPDLRAMSYLYDVLALGTADVWAVGSTSLYPRSRTLIEHWDGSVWKVVPSPNPGKNDELYRIVGTPGGPLWAMGTTLTHHGAFFSTLIERWSGSKWEVVSSPNRGLDSDLWGAAVAPDGDAWAFGWSDDDHHCCWRSLAEHWDGSAWRKVKTPNRKGCYCALFGGAALSSTDVWAVGDGPLQALIEHWDGAGWTLVDGPAVGDDSHLNSVAAQGAGSVWAVGYFHDPLSKARTLTEHWDGMRWSVVSSPSAGDESFLEGIAAVPDTGELWAVGSSRNGDTDSPLIELFS